MYHSVVAKTPEMSKLLLKHMHHCHSFTEILLLFGPPIQQHNILHSLQQQRIHVSHMMIPSMLAQHPFP